MGVSESRRAALATRNFFWFDSSLTSYTASVIDNTPGEFVGAKV